ncbi:DUF2975 domain-containing protein [Legionella pneumophila]|uniref:DUF2975 domain-containing protein n=1 Tax=Legionella pneumophila TaxID=446 RepID=UPI0001527F0F|nr:DUF2975 domain-containing protein [Legionella pneumophila]ABQ57072.1 hypothetical protein LPC_3185 [Legionella pneumophila str. Corby]MCK1857794.1 DUF2975 domain-containing protein [Legionella pneumophila]MCK1889944.1 DUF2975 domain-containing protein [Legionella pneumophila]MDW8959725.1 DUF2975 domain-containing protein [Legionella pneumophila]MDW9009369.1 DUF2975 domain-containing protein [Legionella pneumophila]
MNKIQRVSSIFKTIFIISSLLLAGGFIVSWLAVYMSITQIEKPWANFSIALISTLANLLILFFLIQLFDSYKKNSFFAVSNVKFIRNIGYILLAEQILIPLCKYIASSVTWVGISIDRIEMMFLAFLIIINSWIMMEAYRIQEEQQLTV